MGTLLPLAFFARPAPLVAQALLGKYLVVLIDSKPTGFMIVETEAYEGVDDRASHARRGVTPRTRVMFGPSGHFYVYLIYGVHFMLNVVTHREGIPSAVLIRGIEGVSGPGRVTNFLSVTHIFNTRAASKKTGLWFEERGVLVRSHEVMSTARIGVEYAGPVWAEKPWRYVYTPALHS